MNAKSPAEMTVSAPRRSPWRNLSLFWLVPLLTLAVVLGVAWQNYADRGTLITITFQNASGIVAGETGLRYRDVEVGKVEEVGFSEDLSLVRVEVRVENEVIPYLDDQASFWVVRPQVSARGISGLSTVLSGVYIEGAWDQTPGNEAREFTGSDAPPLVQPGENGTRVVIRAVDGTTISEGSPVLYRGVQVGQLEQPRLTNSGDSILVDAFIQAPHDRLLTTASRFWDASGFSVSFGTSGFQLDVDSLASLVTGGVSFDTIHEGGSPVQPGQVFALFEDEDDARRRPFLSASDEQVKFTVQFGESVEGLTSGAAVTYRGLPVGEVQALRSELEETRFGMVLGLKADIALDPHRVGLPPDMTDEEILRFFSGAVANGLRARLGTASFFGSDLIVELEQMPDAPFAALNTNAEPYPILPSVESELPDFTTTAQGILDRVDSLPIEEVMNQAISLMQSIEEVARAEGTRQAPDAVLGLVEDTRALIGSEDTQAIPAQLRQTVTDLRIVVGELREQKAVDALSEALTSADEAADAVYDTMEDVPELIEDLGQVAKKAEQLPLEELAESARRILDTANELVGSEETRQLPAALAGALEEVEAALAELREGGTVENVNATLASARDAADSIADAADQLPELTNRLNQLVAQSEALVATYGERGNFNSQTLGTLRDVSETAKAVTRLVRELERNPNSLLFGR